MDLMVRWNEVLGAMRDGITVTWWLGPHCISSSCATEIEAKELYEWFEVRLSNKITEENERIARQDEVIKRQTEAIEKQSDAFDDMDEGESWKKG